MKEWKEPEYRVAFEAIDSLRWGGKGRSTIDGYVGLENGMNG